MKVRGAVKMKFGSLKPGDEVFVNGMIVNYLCSYYDEDREQWRYVCRDPLDIFGGLFSVDDIKHIVHHSQQQPAMKGQMELC